MWAWALQRVTGLLLVLFLFLHLWNLHFSYRFQTPLDFVFENLYKPATLYSLLGIVVFHGLAGVRTVLVDFGLSLKAQRAVFWTLVVLGSLIVAYGVYKRAFGP